MKQHRTIQLALRSLSILACAIGCGPVGSADDVASLASAVVPDVYGTDASGSIIIKIKTCDWTPVNETNCAYCVVDEGWARVGGGAEIEGETTPGAQLQASFPTQFGFAEENSYGCTGPAGRFDAVWVARSSGAPHRLRAYAVGLQVWNELSGEQFAPLVTPGIDRVSQYSLPNANATGSVFTAETDLPNGYVLVGGGAEILNPSLDPKDRSNGFLQCSYPTLRSVGRVWEACARKDTFNVDTFLKSYGIGIERCPPGWDTCFADPTIRTVSIGATSGYGTVSFAAGPGAMTGVGGIAPDGIHYGRYLTDLFPLSGASAGLTARSKSHVNADSGATYGQALSLTRQW